VISLVPQQQRTAQYSALSERLKRYYGGNNRALTDAEAAQRFNQEVRQLRQRQAQANARPSPIESPDRQAKPPGPGPAQPPEGQARGPEQPANANPAEQPTAIERQIPGPTGLVTPNKAKPEQVPTLKNLVKAKGLAEIMQTAEDLMRQGKFISALDQYDAAQQVAPNYAVTTLGRANAELGASYYTRAEIDLRQAFTQDPSLLEGQYDLRGMLGVDRLEFLVKDLKEIVNREKTKPGPVFLLAYIMYNTGNERLASGYLDLAQKRAGANDTFYRVVRAHWSLPEVEPSPAAPAPAAEQPVPATAPSEMNK
jgi:tetratricopeptide (TPR) repeat protein